MTRRMVAVVGLTVAGMVGAVGVAGAADVATSGAVLDAALGVLGVQVDDPELRDDLLDGVGDAIDDGVIDDGVIDAVTGDPDADDLDDLLGDRIDDGIARWTDEAPAWRVAYAEARTEFRACVDGRDEGENASGCAADLVAALRAAREERRESPSATAPGRTNPGTGTGAPSTSVAGSSAERTDRPGNGNGSSGQDRPSTTRQAPATSQRGANAPGQQGRS